MNNEWPATLRLRDTGLHDDMGGLGQRIFTTAGAGYKKVEYVRSDLVRDAMMKAEAALADIGDADREPGDDLAWCARRAAQALPAIRAALAMTANSQ